MNCPSCAYQSPYAAMRCPQCRQVFDSEAVETLGHLVYLRERLENWRAQGVLDADDASEMLSLAEQEIKTLATKLTLAPLGVAVTTAAPAEVAAASAATVAAPVEPVPFPAALPGERISEHLPESHVHESPHIHAEPVVSTPNGAAAGHSAVLDEPALANQDEMEEPALAAASHSAGASAADASGTRAPRTDTRPAPATPAGPAFEWRNIGTYLLSERTLHGLLGLGAFLILASGVVISTLNPTGLGPIQHLAAVVATTLLFFAAGYVVRQRLHLTIAGATLLGIAGAFVPLTIWTLGQRQILDWETGAIWLMASAVSLPIYLAAYSLLRDRTFALLTAVAQGSVLLAALNRLGVPLEWGLAALVVLTISYVRIAWRLGDGTTGLAWALSWTARLVNPLVLLALLVGKLGSDAWLMTFGRPLGLGSDYAIVAGWWLGWLFYVQSVRLQHRRLDFYAAVWLVPVAYLLTLARVPIEATWHNVGLALLALAYLGWGYRRLRTLTPALSQGERETASVARGERETGPVARVVAVSYFQLVRDPFFQVALLLTIVSAFWQRPTQHSQTVTFALVALFFIASTVLLRLRVPAWVGMFWLFLAYGQGINDWVTVRQYPLAFAILTFALLAAAEIAVRRTGEGDRPLLATIFGLRRGGPAWRSLLGAPLFTTGYLVGMLALSLALDWYWRAPVAVGARRLGTAEILGFAVLLGTLAASSVARRTGLFLYFVAWIALIPIGATAVNIRDWLGRLPHDADAGRLFATVSFVYLLIAWLADRALVTAGGGRYSRPLYLAGYLLLAPAMLISLLDKQVALQVVGFSIVLYAASAGLSHIGGFPSWEELVRRLCGSDSSVFARAVRTFWVYLAVWLLPAWAMILTSVWEPSIGWYAGVLCGFALVYPAVGLWITRVRPEYRWPFYLGGYALSAIAPLVALTDTTVRPIILGLSVALYMASAIVARRSGWLYPVAVLLPVVLWQALGSLDLFDRWYGLGLVVLGLVYGGLGLVLQPLGLAAGTRPDGDASTDAPRPSRWLIRDRIGAYALPFFVVGYALTAIGLARAANQERELATAAFVLAALHLAASTWIFRQPLFGWPTALAAASAVMIALAGEARWYGVGLVILAIVYGVVGVGLHLLVTGQRRLPIRGWVHPYGLPFFVVGYLLGGFGLIWASWQERNLTTLAFGLAMVQYAATAFVFRQPLFGWVTALLLTVTYVLGLTLTSIAVAQRGLGLLPGGLLALLIAEGLRWAGAWRPLPPTAARREHRLRRRPSPLRWRGGAASDAPAETGEAEDDAEADASPSPAQAAGRVGRVTAWSAPWLVVVCAAAVSAPFYSMGDQQTWALAWWGGTALFAALTALFRQPGGLYPALIFGSVAYLATGYVVAPQMLASRSFATLAALTWIYLGAAWLLERWRPASMTAPELIRTSVMWFFDPDGRNMTTYHDRLAQARGSVLPWSAPLHLAGWATLLVASIGSWPNAQDALAASAALAVLLVALAILEGAGSYVWLSLGMVVLTLEHGLRVNNVLLDRQPPYWATASVAAVLLGLALRTARHPRIAVWVQPLSWASLALAGGAVIAATVLQGRQGIRADVQVLALTIALAGLTAIGHAYWRRDRHMVYGGVAMLEIGLFMELLSFKIGQPQAFALPGGAYLLMIAYWEWRRGSAKTVKRLLEAAALVLLLGVSLLQGLGFMGDGYDRYLYNTFLLVESAGLLALGAVLRWRYTFFLGAVALVADVLIMLRDPLRALNTWYLVALIGLVLIGVVIWIERQRQQIPLWVEAWRARLEQWD